MKKSILIFISILAVGYQPNSWGISKYPGIEEVLIICENKSSTGTCHGFLIGATQALALGAVLTKHHCVPIGIITPRQLQQMYILYVNAHPESWGGSAVMMLNFNVLPKYFPCNK